MRLLVAESPYVMPEAPRAVVHIDLRRRSSALDLDREAVAHELPSCVRHVDVPVLSEVALRGDFHEVPPVLAAEQSEGGNCLAVRSPRLGEGVPCCGHERRHPIGHMLDQRASTASSTGRIDERRD